MKFQASKLSAVALCLLMSLAGVVEGRQPNVVFFLVDDLGSDEIVCYASKFHETPHIDALAKTGKKFTQAYSGATLCSPSRAALLTGRSPARLHLTDWIPGQIQINRMTVTPDWQTHMDHERVLLPEAMKEQGYATGFFGKWHLIPRVRPYDKGNPEKIAEIEAMHDDHMPGKHGFDENFGGDHSANQGKRFLYPKYQTFPGLAGMGNEDQCLTDVLTDCAVDFIERKKDEPFFVYLSYYTVHGPITGKPNLVEKYKRKLAANPDADYYMNNPNKAAMIQSLDESVGRVMAKLKEIGQLDNTLVIFTGDNGSQGDEFVVNYRGNKGTAYEGGTRVPLIVTGPGVVRGVCDVPTIGMDFYPTILSYVKAPLKPGEHLDGVNIMPLLDGTYLRGNSAELKALGNRTFYWHYPHYDETTPYSSLLVDGWKIVRYADDGKLELYNLDEDVMEKIDLAARYPEKTAMLAKLLDEELSDVGAQIAQPNLDHDASDDVFSGGIRDLKAWEAKRRN